MVMPVPEWLEVIIDRLDEANNSRQRESAMEDQLRKAIAGYEAEMTEFTKRLIEIPTENPPGTAYRACVDLIADKLAEIGLPCRLVEVPADRPGETRGDREGLPGYCLLSSYGAGVDVLYFHGHYDVVPASSREQFHPHVRKGNLFGRGSSDMKSGLAAMIAAVKAIKACGIELRGKIGLTIVPDEETGGWRGSRYLEEAGLLGPHGIGMLTPEPTGGVVWNANRGAISLRVTVKGKPAHVGLHYRGVNAFERMLTVAGALSDLKREVMERHTRFNITPEAARASILMMGGQCAGGTSFNLVPGECAFTVDRRINPEEDLAVEKRRLIEVFERLRQQGVELEVEILQEAPSAGADDGDPVAVALARSIEAVTGARATFELCPGLLENRWYARHGVPAFAYGPGLLTVAHGPHEFVPLENIPACALIYALTAVRLLGAS
jgi:acetylornithine deacetylase/succinyl-diaminopimelate desuccinylase family protein